MDRLRDKSLDGKNGRRQHRHTPGGHNKRLLGRGHKVHKYDYVYPVHSVINVNPVSEAFCVAYSMLQKFGLPQLQALSETMSAELATIGVSCKLSSHVLSVER